MNAENVEKLRELVNSMLFTVIGFVIAILVLVVLIEVIRSRYRSNDGLTDPNDEILNQIEDLHREGDVSDEEFRSIKSQITRRTDP